MSLNELFLTQTAMDGADAFPALPVEGLPPSEDMHSFPPSSGPFPFMWPTLEGKSLTFPQC